MKQFHLIDSLNKKSEIRRNIAINRYISKALDTWNKFGVYWKRGMIKVDNGYEKI